MSNKDEKTVAPSPGQQAEKPNESAQDNPGKMEGMEIMNTVDQWFKLCHKLQLRDTYAYKDMWDEQTDQLEAAEDTLRIARMVERFGLEGLLKLLEHYCHAVFRTAEGNRSLQLLMYSLKDSLRSLSEMLRLAICEVESGPQDRQLLRELKKFSADHTHGSRQ